MTDHRAFFGDAEYDFRLTKPLILELERNTGAGIGSLCDRVFKRQFSQNDLSEVIRLGLIGGGMTAKRAAEMVAAYLPDRPIAEVQTLATAILLARWLGKSKENNGQI